MTWRPLRLDRHLAGPQLETYLLVQLSRYNQRHDLAFARASASSSVRGHPHLRIVAVAG
jgi:hypothetical protein